MSIISPSNFKGERSIAQVEQQQVSQNVQWFIDKYEPIFLKKLLGDTLYKEFVDGLNEDQILPKWTDLRDGTDLKAMLIDFVYYYYQNNNLTNTGGVGESKIKSDNAIAASPYPKMINAWNEMVNMARLFDLSTDTYPNWNRFYWRKDIDCFVYCHRKCVPDIYEYKNQLGL